jgi:hypothetical protein
LFPPLQTILTLLNLHELFWPKFFSLLQLGGKILFWGVKIFHDCTVDWGDSLVGGTGWPQEAKMGQRGHVWAARAFAAIFVVL